jgi:hypothetical protein
VHIVLQKQFIQIALCFWTWDKKGVYVEQKHLSTDELEQWAGFLQAHNLVNLAIILLNSAGAWGFVGGQLLWMLTPFFSEPKLKQLAELLENPEAIRELRDYLDG